MKDIIRTLLITGILLSSSMHGMKRANTALTPHNQEQQIQPFSWLPVELIDKIAGQCEPVEKDLMNKVCQAWRTHLRNKEMILIANPATVTPSHKLKKMFEYIYSGNAQKLAIWLSVLSAQDINGAIDSVDYSPDLKVDRNPLEIAIENNDIQSVQVLIQYGADVNYGEEDGYMSPLMTASFHGYTHIAQLLLDHGAHVDYADNREDTSLIIASRKCHIDTVQLLLDRKANVNQAGSCGWTPLHEALEESHIDIVQLLLDRGARINQADDKGWTPLIAASFYGHIESVRLLLDRGAQVNQADNDGWTPLIAASFDGHIEVVRLLLSHDADIHQAITNNFGIAFLVVEIGDTALQIAQKQGHIEIVKLIQEKLELDEIDQFWT